MSLWSKSELENLFICTLPHDFHCTGVSIDTRTLKSGDLFLAVTGDNFDGHAFAKVAESKGASAIVATKPLPEISCPVIVVDSILGALQDLGRTARQRTKATIIAITGSVGKTSVKDMVSKILSVFGSTYSAPASYNNHWGVPLTLSRLPRDAQYGVIEIGMNHVGEIAPLSDMVRPHVALITAIASAHIGNLGGLDEIAKEKSAIFHGLEKNGIAILPLDSDHFDYLKTVAAKSFPSHILSFGKNQKANARLKSYKVTGDNTAQVTAVMGDTDLSYTLPILGQHMAVNSVCALSVAMALRLNLKKAKEAFKSMGTTKGRCQIHHLTIPMKQGTVPITLLDDSFNANSHSMKAGIDVLVSLKREGKGRCVVVLGEMLELGSHALKEHQIIADYCQQLGISTIFTCGGTPIAQAFKTMETSHREKAGELIPLVMEGLQENDLVLVKGSKGSQVSLVAEALISAATPSKQV